MNYIRTRVDHGPPYQISLLGIHKECPIVLVNKTHILYANYKSTLARTPYSISLLFVLIELEVIKQKSFYTIWGRLHLRSSIMGVLPLFSTKLNKHHHRDIN